MSGNFTDVREMSGVSLKIMEMSGNCQGKNCPKTFIIASTGFFSSTHLVLYANYSLVHVECLTCVSYVVEMRTEDCVTYNFPL